MIAPDALAAHFIAACRAELAALKPGNVHAHAGGHTMEVADFEQSAIAAAPAIADPRLSVGAKVRKAVSATWDAVGCNTNLGIVLLCAPLAKAAEAQSARSLRDRLHHVLARLTVADAADAFAAIAMANPAGLGRAETGDVAAPARMTLREAMDIAAGRDRIARAYVTDFADIFEVALPAYREALATAAAPGLAVTTLHMRLLAAFPDSHIARKHGPEAAVAVQREAARIAAQMGRTATEDDIPRLLAFDADLKARRLNPGTTADFVVATLFASAIEREIAASRRS